MFVRRVIIMERKLRVSYNLIKNILVANSVYPLSSVILVAYIPHPFFICAKISEVR